MADKKNNSRNCNNPLEKKKANGKEIIAKTLSYLLIILAIITVVANIDLTVSFSVGENYRNVTVDTRVNITNAAPEIINISLDQNIVLNAGSIKVVECNVSVRDWNNYTDIKNASAVFYHTTLSSENAADNNNTHYTNNNCSVISEGGLWKNFSCTFNVYYYAEPGTWNCSVVVYDYSDYNDTGYNITTVEQVLALNVTPVIDYGNLAVTDTSANKTANVTNIGNVPINISVKGYGAVEGDGLAFVCEVGNITIENEKFSASPSDDYAAKTALSSNFQPITGLTINKQIDPAILKTNTTYWQLYVPPNPFGACNGSVVFQAEAS